MGEGGLVVGARVMEGSGGIDRGRGDADLRYGEEAEGGAERFLPRALDPARWLDPGSSALLGVGSTAPAVDPQAEGAGLEAVEGAGGAGTWRRRLAPRHREAVRGFFGPEGSDTSGASGAAASSGGDGG